MLFFNIKDCGMKIFLVVLLVALLPLESYSQFELLKRKTQEKVESKIEEALEEKNDEEEKTEEEEVKEKTKKNETGSEVKEEKLSTFSKYDFVPGDSVVFFEDFSQDNIADFPALWFTNGSGEVVTTNKYSGKWFKMRQESMFYLENGFNFPKNFTMEFDVIPVDNGEEQQTIGFDLTLYQTDNDEQYNTMYVPGKQGVVFNLYTFNNVHSYSTYENGHYRVSGDYSEEIGLLNRDIVNHVNIWVQDRRVRLYIHGQKIFDIPKGFSESPNFNQIRFWLTEGSEPMISNIRIAATFGDTRSKLLAEGKIISYGIYFDIGKDVVKPESYPSIKQIADFLNENALSKIEIIGHTDSDGSPEKNLALSQARSAAVRTSLISEFKIDGSRITTQGKGDKEPLADNKTIEGKAKNRRVEFIKK